MTHCKFCLLNKSCCNVFFGLWVRVSSFSLDQKDGFLNPLFFFFGLFICHLEFWHWPCDSEFLTLFFPFEFLNLNLQYRLFFTDFMIGTLNNRHIIPNDIGIWFFPMIMMWMMIMILWLNFFIYSNKIWMFFWSSLINQEIPYYTLIYSD